MGFDFKKGTVFMRDGFVQFSDANVSITSSPFLYGLAIYTVLSLNRDPMTKKLVAFRLEDHYRRLVASAKIMDFDSFSREWDFARFENMVLELVEKNNLASHVGEDFLIRVSVFIDALAAGTKIHGLPNTLCAYVYPMGEILPRAGVNVCISSYRRNPENAIPSRAKVNGGYANVSLMKNEALLKGFDDAIALTQDGFVAEGTVANIFIKKGETLITPSTDSDILEGITRASIITLAREMGMEVTERKVEQNELYTADEAFVCGTSARITPILSIDKSKIGLGDEAGKIGDMTAKLSKKYEEIQRGIVKEHAEWRKEI